MNTHYAIASALTFFISIIVGSLVFLKNKKSFVNQSYFFLTLSTAFWAIGIYFHAVIQNTLWCLFWGRFAHIGASFIPAFYLQFILSFCDCYKEKRFIIRAGFILAILFSIISFHPWFFTSLSPKSRLTQWADAGIIYPFFVMFFGSYMLYAFYIALKTYGKLSIYKRNQLKYILIASIAGFLGGSSTFLVVYNIKIKLFHPYVIYFVSFYNIVITYAIIRYRLMDITVAVTRTGIFIAVYTLVLGLPFAIAGWFRTWLIATLGAQWWIAPLGLMAALATVGPFIYIYIDRKAEDRLLKEQKRYQQTLKQASVGMTRIRNLRKLLDLITHIVTKTVRISYAAIYLYNQQTEEYVLQVMRDKGRVPVPKIPSDNPLVSWIMVKREPLIYEEIKRQMEDTSNATYKLLEENMRLLTATVVIPSFLEDRFIGFIVLGDKVSGQIYTPEDLSVFEVLASQAALAIENAQFYEEAKEMQDQISQAEKMATIGTMADGLSHQINNRFYALSLIAGDTIDTIKMTDTSKCTPEVKEMITQINHALERIQTNVMQGGDVVKGILKYTRKGDEGFEALDLNKVLDNTLEMVQFKVKLSEIDIIRDFNTIPKIKGNMVQLEEVFFNFIDNAYDAIVERRTLLKEEGYRGKITISAHLKDDTLEIIIADNGMGIKDNNNQKVFTPFFTTKTSARRGTGLGLYVINKIITDAHKGKIAFESAYKVGTRFIVELPIAK